MAQPHLLNRADSVGRRSAAAPANEFPLDAQLSAWLDDSAAGDAEAFESLYDASCSRIYGLVLTVVRSRCRAAQVTEDVYVEIHHRAQSLASGPADPMAAMLSLAHRRAVDEVRRPAGEPQPLHLTAPSGQRDRLSLPRNTRLQAVLLDPLQQEVLVLAYLGGYTVRQVSALLALPSHTVKLAITTALSGLGARAVSSRNRPVPP